jgi:threonine/homoserine/homoserine lactone efflux protein
MVHANVTTLTGVAALVILAPGPDSALVTKNALVHAAARRSPHRSASSAA